MHKRRWHRLLIGICRDYTPLIWPSENSSHSPSFVIFQFRIPRVPFPCFPPGLRSLPVSALSRRYGHSELVDSRQSLRFHDFSLSIFDSLSALKQTFFSVAMERGVIPSSAQDIQGTRLHRPSLMPMQTRR